MKGAEYLRRELGQGAAGGALVPLPVIQDYGDGALKLRFANVQLPVFIVLSGEPAGFP